MANNKLRVQITEVNAGDDLQFIRNCTDGHITLTKQRKLYVINVRNGTAKVAFTMPSRDGAGGPDAEHTFESEGFRWCRYLPTSLLIRNCRKVKG